MMKKAGIVLGMILLLSIAGCSRDQKEIYQGDGYTLQIPQSWLELYKIEEGEEDGFAWAAFYEKGCREEMEGGWLFSVTAYDDESYQDMPAYEVLGQKGDITYIALFPTDVQYEGASEESVKQYQKMAEESEEVLDTFEIL